MEACLILGAGFSHVAGLPLANSLFDVNEMPDNTPDKLQQHFREVLYAYRVWTANNPGVSAEVWFQELYTKRDFDLFGVELPTIWTYAIRFALARLIKLKGNPNPTAYYHGISLYQAHPIHIDFWRKIEEQLSVKNIVTMNYDLLIEQALHRDKGPHRSEPQCRYGGFPHFQSVRKLTNVTTRKHELVELGDKYLLFKLHGSVNWAREHHSSDIKIHDDVRAVFRRDKKVGDPAIVPPIPEKEMPEDFQGIWRNAARALEATDVWVICGYGLPEYDLALKAFFSDILEREGNKTILIIDPESENLSSRWDDLSNGKASIIPMPGLPEALELDWLEYLQAG